MKLKIYYSKELDPYLNLALEDCLFRGMSESEQILFLYTNSPSVVMGRFQNPWVEANLKAIEHEDVKLVRRQSGGGTVYHDLNNSNFSFLSPKDDYDKDRNLKIVVQALLDLGIEAQTNERNDIVVRLPSEDFFRKVSGSAFKQTRLSCFHHGTLLVNANLKELGRFLKPKLTMAQSKGIKSVRSKVANLNSFGEHITQKSLWGSLTKSFEKFYAQEVSVGEIDKEYLNESSRERYRFWSSWDWIYGETPKFSHQLELRTQWGLFECDIHSHKGLIKEVQLSCPEVHPLILSTLQDALIDCPYRKDDVSERLMNIRDLEMYPEELRDFRQRWIETLF